MSENPYRNKTIKTISSNVMNYDIDEYPHYKGSNHAPKGIGCCCECKSHSKVNGYPCRNGKSILETSLYICNVFKTPYLSSQHSIGCEYWEK